MARLPQRLNSPLKNEVSVQEKSAPMARFFVPETPRNRLSRAAGVAPGEGVESDTQCASLGES